MDLTPDSQRHRTLNLVTSSISELLKDTRRYDRANTAIVHTLLSHLEKNIPQLPTIEFSEKETEKYDVAMAFISLIQIEQSLKECEYYFRRYPFHDLPVSKGSHLRNTCEMLFDRVSQFRDRLKILTKFLQKLQATNGTDYGYLIKAFDKAFYYEIRSRNMAHHNKRYEYQSIDQLQLIDLLSQSAKLQGLPNADMIYRLECRKWIKRVRMIAIEIDKVIEHICIPIQELPHWNSISIDG